MRRVAQQWKSLSPEVKLGAVIMPIILALFAGLVVPMLSNALSPKTTPERRGVVKVLDVETGVPLSDFVAAHEDVPTPPMGMVLAAAVVDPSETAPPGAAPDNAASKGGGADGGVGAVEGGTGDAVSDGDGTDGDGGGEDDKAADDNDHGDNSTGDDGDTGDNSTGDDGGTGDNSTGDDGDDSDTGANAGDNKVDDDKHDSENKDLDSDGDGVLDADDLCPMTAGDSRSGCPVAALRVEPYGCSSADMITTLESDERGPERCDDLNAVLGGTTGSKPGDVKARADAVAAALHETRSSNEHGQAGRLEPMGVVVSISATITGFDGEDVHVAWSLRGANGRRLPHKWLKNRPVMKLTGEAQTDTGSEEFWVPLPKRPHGPFSVRIAMTDDNRTPLTFANTQKFG
jgi:hypothetical protein